MNYNKLIITVVFVALSLATPLSSHARDQPSVNHVSNDLIELAAEFRAFRSPLFRSRTWRPTHQVDGPIPHEAQLN